MSETGKTITMADIAERIGVSKNAVSLALAGKPGASEATRARIVAAARELGYDRTEQARLERACIAAIVPEYSRRIEYGEYGD